MSKYVISRASSFRDSDPPCEEAFKERIIVTDERGSNNPSQFKDWFDEKYFNHRIENGHIKRDFYKDQWFVEIENILEFVNKYGRIIINKYWQNKEYYEITIYDDYVE